MRFLTHIIFPALLLSQLALAQQETRMVYLVRHAEAASTAPDAALTPAGQKRAECLAKTFKDAGIKQIFVTDAKRTQETAAPLAKELKITPTIIPAKDPNKLIQSLLYSSAGGGNILVVGHSNTLPFVLARIKAGTVAPIGEDEFDRLFVTTVIESGVTQASTLRYCDCGSAPAAPAHAAPASKSGKKGTTKKQ
ncbi:MAG TPA: phosphoglycerate mutase family protein [Candidatus Angelobacter sp.]|jgi:phosphohistidine phosphatase SixA|nr:phosphoglycerate mutase family protein [Candidatus Angelobacter sp.]